MIGFTEAVILSASLPVISTHITPSFTVCLSLSAPACPLCDLGLCGRQADRLQAAEEIGSRPRHGRADQLIKPSFGGARQKVKTGVILPASFANLCFYIRALNTPSRAQRIKEAKCWSDQTLRLVSSVFSAFKCKKTERKDRPQLKARCCKLAQVEMAH